jgi:hypothetical protein
MRAIVIKIPRYQGTASCAIISLNVDSYTSYKTGNVGLITSFSRQKFVSYDQLLPIVFNILAIRKMALSP